MSAFDIVGFDNNYKVPRFAASIIFGAGLISAASLDHSVLLVGMKTSAGSMVADQDVLQVFSYDDVDAACGPGSQLARMAYRAIDLGGTLPIYIAAVAEPGASDAATATLLIGGTWTTGGQLTLNFAGESITQSVGASDTIDVFGAALAARFNQYTRLPATASYNAGTDTLTITCRNVGIQGKDWILHLDRSLAPAGMTLTLTGSATVGSSDRVRLGASATGTGTENVTTILTRLQTKRYARLGVAQNDATNVGRWKTHVETLAGPLSLLLEQVVTAQNAALATSTALANTINAQRVQVLWARNCESHPCEIAAAKAALRANTEGNGQVPNYDKAVLKGIAPVRAGFESDLPTDAELQTVLSNGVTPITTDGGNAVVVRSIVSHSSNGTDFRTLDVGDVVVPDFVTLDLQLGWETDFLPNNPFVGPDQPPEGESEPVGVATPVRWNAYLTNKLEGYFKANMIQRPSLYPPVSTYNTLADRIQSIVTLVVRRVQHQIGVVVRQQR